MSDTVQLAIVAGIIAIATLIIKAIIDAHAKRVEIVAAAAAAAATLAAKQAEEKLSQKLETVEIKIDGRLTQLLEMTKRAYLAEGKAEGTKTHVDPTTPLSDADLKITGGEIKITTETKKKKP